MAATPKTVTRVHRDTRRLILELAEDLFQSRGYQGFSYHDISKPLGIKNAAIHYHFPSKADLGVALIDRARAMLKRRTGRFLEQGGDPVMQLEGYFRFNRRYVKGQAGKVCPIGSVATGYATIPDAMRRRAQLLVDETLSWLEKALDLGRQQGAFRFSGGPRARAVGIMSAMQGAVQLARISGLQVFEDAVTDIRVDLSLKG